MTASPPAARVRADACPGALQTHAAADLPPTPAEVAAEQAMREAEVAVVQHVATNDQRRRVAAMAQVHSRADRRRVWMSFDPAGRQLG